MINRFYKSAPVEFKYPETPLQPLMMAAEARQKRFDVAYSTAEELRNKYIDALPQDRMEADKWSGGIQSRIDEMVTKYQGDYSSLYREIGSLKSEVNKDLSPMGKAGNIVSNKMSYTKALEEERERLKKGDITQSQLSNWMGYTMSNYTGVGEKDPVTGNFNLVQPEGIAQYVDGYDISQEIVAKLPAIINADEVIQKDGQWIAKRGESWSVVSPERINQAVQGSLLTNAKYMNYLSQTYRHQGKEITPQDLLGEVGTISQSLAGVYARKDFKGTRDLDANPYGEIRARENAKMSSLMSLMQPTGIPDTYSQSVNTGMDKYKAKVPGLDNTPLGIPSYGGTRPYIDPFADGSGTSYSEYSLKQMQNIPEGMKGAMYEIIKGVQANPKLKTDQARNTELAKKKNAYLDKFATKDITNTRLVKSQYDLMEKTWEPALQTASFFKRNKDGKLEPVDARNPPKAIQKIKANAKEHMPSGITYETGNVGYQVYDRESGDEYFVTNISDKLTNSFRPTAQLTAPYFTGNKSDPMFTGPNTAIRTKLNKDINNPKLELEVTKDGGKTWKVDKDADADALIELYRNQAGMENARASNFSSQFMNFGDTKQMFDNPAFNYIMQDDDN